MTLMLLTINDGTAEELQRRQDRLDDIFNEVTRTGVSFTLYKVPKDLEDPQPSVVIVEYHQYQAMLEMLQELGEDQE